MIKISIITITYNSEKTLEQTIKSVVDQGYANLEYIIIDGGSKDGTLDIVNKYRDKIAVVVSEKDNGISDAFNKGIRIASGDIIGIINSDDLLAKDALTILSEVYSEDVDVYRGNLIIWDDVSDKKYVNYPTMNFDVTRSTLSVCHPSTFISKNAYDKWGLYDVELRYMMDADILFRFYSKGAVFKHIDKPLAIFRLGGVTSDNWKRKIPEYKKVLKVNGASAFTMRKKLFIYRMRNGIKGLLFKVFSDKSTRKIFYEIKRD